MKFKNREEIKNILNMDIENTEKKDLIANIKNYRGSVCRAISVDKELDLKGGQIIETEKAKSWAKFGNEFAIETTREIEYSFIIENEVEGYEVQYFDFDNIFNDLYINEGLSEEEAEDMAIELAEDEVYVELMELLGSSGDMGKEQEILVPANTKLRVKTISDGRDDTGFIEVVLEAIKE